MNARDHTDPLTPVTRSELHAELGPIREIPARIDQRMAATEQEFARLDQRMAQLATKEEFARLDQRMTRLATNEELAQLEARLTWRIILAMGVLTAIFSAIVAMLNNSPGG